VCVCVPIYNTYLTFSQAQEQAQIMSSDTRPNTLTLLYIRIHAHVCTYIHQQTLSRCHCAFCACCRFHLFSSSQTCSFPPPELLLTFIGHVLCFPICFFEYKVKTLLEQEANILFTRGSSRLDNKASHSIKKMFEQDAISFSKGVRIP
jgi:hypothetical protein